MAGGSDERFSMLNTDPPFKATVSTFEMETFFLISRYFHELNITFYSLNGLKLKCRSNLSVISCV